MQQSVISSAPATLGCSVATERGQHWCFMSVKVARSLGASIEIGSVTQQSWTNVTAQNLSDETDCGLDLEQQTKIFDSQVYKAMS